MRSPLGLLAGALLFCPLLVLPFAPAACDDTPRGEQGIDFLADGSLYTVPPTPEAGPDAIGPCTEAVDAGAICADLSSSGTAYTHFISCTNGVAPFGLSCVATGAAVVNGVATFCCTTGLL
jgi:hypothetical protein